MTISIQNRSKVVKESQETRKFNKILWFAVLKIDDFLNFIPRQIYMTT